jgi:hypothetical protein
MIGDPEGAIAVYRQAVWPTVIFRNEAPFEFGCYLENAAMGNVD